MSSSFLVSFVLCCDGQFSASERTRHYTGTYLGCVYIYLYTYMWSAELVNIEACGSIPVDPKNNIEH